MIACACVDTPSSSFPVPNIGTDIGTTIRELAELIAQYAQFQGEVVRGRSKPNGTARKVLDVSRLREKLNGHPQTSLRDGLSRTIDWYLKNKRLADQRQ